MLDETVDRTAPATLIWMPTGVVPNPADFHHNKTVYPPEELPAEEAVNLAGTDEAHGRRLGLEPWLEIGVRIFLPVDIGLLRMGWRKSADRFSVSPSR